VGLFANRYKSAACFYNTDERCEAELPEMGVVSNVWGFDKDGTIDDKKMTKQDLRK
jgi:hypothetical protein